MGRRCVHGQKQQLEADGYIFFLGKGWNEEEKENEQSDGKLSSVNNHSSLKSLQVESNMQSSVRTTNTTQGMFLF